MRFASQLRRIHAHLLLPLLGLLLARPSLPFTAAGSVLVVAGLVLRFWAAGVLEKGGTLCTDGPYARVRHPLYLGSLTAALGFTIMVKAIWGWVLVLPLFLALYAAQLLEEERHLRSLYGEAHAEYGRRVPILFPSPGRRTTTSGRSWKLSQALANREHYHVVFTLVLVALFFVKWRFMG